VEQYPSEDAARSAVGGLVVEINSGDRRMYSNSMTVSQLSDHFEQRELGRDNTWRSYATKKSYHTYLKRWIVPHWGEYGLFQIRTVEVESWLRRLPLAKSSCAKLRNLMSVLFNHACRYELFDRNPIRFVRQSAKRRTAPTLLAPIEIKMLVEGLGLRERTLVLLAASTGLRESELFGLKWGDIDFAAGIMNVTRSVVYGIVGPCKTESSQKPVPLHPLLAENLAQWRERSVNRKSEDWIFPSRRYRGRKPCWGHAILRRYIRPAAKNQGIEKRIGWHTFSPDLRNTSEERRHRIQGDARADAAFFAAIHAGHLCTSDDAGQARCASGCGVANVPSRVEQRSRFRLRGESDLMQSTGEVSGRRTQMGRKTVPFLHPSVFLWNNA
jgi:integrase